MIPVDLASVPATNVVNDSIVNTVIIDSVSVSATDVVNNSTTRDEIPQPRVPVTDTTSNCSTEYLRMEDDVDTVLLPKNNAPPALYQRSQAIT